MAATEKLRRLARRTSRLRNIGHKRGNPQHRARGKGKEPPWPDTAAQTYEDLGYDRIFVSLDGSDQQDKVLDRAILLAANDNAELYIGHVIDSTALEAAGTFPVDVVPSLEKAFRESIDAKVRAAEANPSIKKVEVIVRAGRIRETIKDEMLDVINPDLVICGARGLSSIKYAILGSISTFLTRNTECDTLVIK